MADHILEQSENPQGDDVIDVRCSCGWSANYSRNLGRAEATWWPSTDGDGAGRHELRWPPPPATSNGSG